METEVMEKPTKPKSNAMVRTTVFVPSSLMEAAKAHSDRTGANLASTVRTALRDFLAKQPKE